jgi:beta-galactosidase GanA
VEVTERWQGSRRLVFVLNHTASPQALTLDRAYQHLLDGHEALDGQVTLAPREVLVLADQPTSPDKASSQ